MPVHQTNEFYIYISSEYLKNKENIKEAETFVEDNGFDFILDDGFDFILEEGFLVIETFYDKYKAQAFEDKVLSILKK